MCIRDSLSTDQYCTGASGRDKCIRLSMAYQMCIRDRKEYFAGRTVKVCAAPVDRI